MSREGRNFAGARSILIFQGDIFQLAIVPKTCQATRKLELKTRKSNEKQKPQMEDREPRESTQSEYEVEERREKVSDKYIVAEETSSSDTELGLSVTTGRHSKENREHFILTDKIMRYFILLKFIFIRYMSIKFLF